MHERLLHQVSAVTTSDKDHVLDNINLGAEGIGYTSNESADELELSFGTMRLFQRKGIFVSPVRVEFVFLLLIDKEIHHTSSSC
jgi:hypothetical protein